MMELRAQTIFPTFDRDDRVTEFLLCTKCSTVFLWKAILDFSHCPKCSPAWAVRNRILGTHR